MRIALDTNRYVDFCKNDPEAVRIIQRAKEIILPFVVVAELRAGFAYGNQSKQNESVFTRFLNKPRVRTIYADDGTTRAFANLYRQLRIQGTPIPTNDVWIAAICTQHDLLLATRDAHFSNLPQIPIV